MKHVSKKFDVHFFWILDIVWPLGMILLLVVYCDIEIQNSGSFKKCFFFFKSMQFLKLKSATFDSHF